MSENNRQRLYNRAVLIFGTSGDLYASEDALRIVRRSEPIAAAATDGGVVFGSARETATRLVEDGEENTLYKLDDHIGAIVAGNGIDARHVIDKMQHLAQHERLEYGTAITPEELARQTETAVEDAIDFDTDRPHGMVSLFGGVIHDRAVLYEVLPHGETNRYRGVAAGRNRGLMMDYFEEHYEAGHSLEETRQLVAGALAEVHDLSETDVQTAFAEVPTETGTYRQVENDVVDALISNR